MNLMNILMIEYIGNHNTSVQQKEDKKPNMFLSPDLNNIINNINLQNISNENDIDTKIDNNQILSSTLVNDNDNREKIEPIKPLTPGININIKNINNNDSPLCNINETKSVNSGVQNS
eukprot:243205_1